MTKFGKPIVTVKRRQKSGKRVFGSAKGKIAFHEGWDSPMTDRELEEFLGAGDAGQGHLSRLRGRRNAPPFSPGARRGRKRG